MARLVAHGGSTIRLWSDFYERGTTDLESFRAVRGWAEELGVRILLVLFSPAFLSDIYEERSRFDQGLTMYNGICDRATDVITSEAATDAIVQRCRDVLSVFADSPALAGWELVNQADDLYDVDCAAMRGFISRLAERIRAEDRKSGQERLLAASSSHPVPPGWLLDLDELDFVAIHPYAEAIEFPTNRFDGAVHVAAAIRYALERQRAPRPVLDTESGIIGQLYVAGLPRPDIAFRAEMMHNLRWAHVAAGGAGTGLHVPINDEGMTAERRVPLSRIRWEPLAAELDDIAAISAVWSRAPRRGTIRPLGDLARVDRDDVVVIASRADDRVLGWLLRDTRIPDFVADATAAMAAGPTRPANLDLRLHALDAWRAALGRLSIDPVAFSGRKAITLLLGRGGPRTPRACSLIDEGLAHLHDVTRRTAPWLLEVAAPEPTPVTVSVDGLPPQAYRLLWIDDTDARVLGAATVVGPAITATSPPLLRHLAFVLTPQ